VLPSPPEGLRHWRADDAPALEAAWADPEIVRWNRPPDGLDAVAWIAGAEQRWDRRLALDLVVVPPPIPDERSDRFARVGGEVGLQAFTRDPARAELGVWVAAPHRGRGMAARAVRSVAEWAFEDLALDQLWARTHPANEAAGALFARLAWDRLGTSDGMSIWSATATVLR
jgi:RimJ/RimL family protein N-acetyltransferase